MAKKNKKRVGRGVGGGPKQDTLRQKRLLKILSVELGNIGRGNKAKSLTEIMLMAGYSESTARQQSSVLAGVQTKLDPIVTRATELRDKTMAYMTDGKFKKTGLSTLVYMFDIFTKNIELLSGRATERNYSLTDEERDKIMALKNRK